MDKELLEIAEKFYGKTELNKTFKLINNEKRFIFPSKESSDYTNQMNKLYAKMEKLPSGTQQSLLSLFLKNIQHIAKSKNPTSTAINKCKRLLAETDSHKPTISHYRDMENGKESDILQQADKYVNSLRNKDKKFYAKYYLRSKLYEQPLQPHNYNLSEMGKQAVRMNIDSILRKLQNGTKTTARNPVKRVVNGNPLATIIRDSKRKLESLQEQLKKLPRNETAKRHRLQLSIDMIKESLKFYAKNPVKSKVKRNPVKAVAVKRVSNAKGDDKILVYLNKAITFNKSKITSFRNALKTAKTISDKAYYKERILEAQNKTRRLVEQKQALTARKPNFTSADFRQFLKGTTAKNSEMFQGKVSGARTQVLVSDSTPKNLSRLGMLKQMIVKLPNGQKAKLTFEKDAYLAMDIRRNLHAIGSGARINGVKVTGSGLAELGDLIQIDYQTAKSHIGNGKETYFYHKLGEVTKEYPKLFVDKDRFPVIVNGNYDIWKDGIVN